MPSPPCTYVLQFTSMQQRSTSSTMYIQQDNQNVNKAKELSSTTTSHIHMINHTSLVASILNRCTSGPVEHASRQERLASATHCQLRKSLAETKPDLTEQGVSRNCSHFLSCTILLANTNYPPTWQPLTQPLPDSSPLSGTAKVQTVA